MDLTPADKQRLWDAVLSADPYGYQESWPTWDADTIYFEGYLSLTSILKAAEVIEALKAARAHA